jgi:hypothetical protein
VSPLLQPPKAASSLPAGNHDFDHENRLEDALPMPLSSTAVEDKGAFVIALTAGKPVTALL